MYLQCRTFPWLWWWFSYYFLLFPSFGPSWQVWGQKFLHSLVLNIWETKSLLYLLCSTIALLVVACQAYQNELKTPLLSVLKMFTLPFTWKVPAGDGNIEKLFLRWSNLGFTYGFLSHSCEGVNWVSLPFYLWLYLKYFRVSWNRFKTYKNPGKNKDEKSPRRSKIFCQIFVIGKINSRTLGKKSIG